MRSLLKQLQIYRRCVLKGLFYDFLQQIDPLILNSVTQFNQLIDLEAEYAKSGRAVANGLEDALKVNQYLCGELTKIIEGHDRHTMSKKMPACIAPPVPPMYSSRDGR